MLLQVNAVLRSRLDNLSVAWTTRWVGGHGTLQSQSFTRKNPRNVVFFCWEKVYDFQMPCVKMLGGHQDFFQEGTVVG